MVDSIFLESSDVERLTGTKVKKLQLQHLSKSKIPFQLDRNGNPLVLKETLYAMTKTKAAPKREVPTINYQSLN